MRSICCRPAHGARRPRRSHRARSLLVSVSYATRLATSFWQWAMYVKALCLCMKCSDQCLNPRVGLQQPPSAVTQSSLPTRSTVKAPKHRALSSPSVWVPRPALAVQDDAAGGAVPEGVPRPGAQAPIIPGAQREHRPDCGDQPAALEQLQARWRHHLQASRARAHSRCKSSKTDHRAGPSTGLCSPSEARLPRGSAST